jgi:hypothetical protein
MNPIHYVLISTSEYRAITENKEYEIRKWGQVVILPILAGEGVVSGVSLVVRLGNPSPYGRQGCTVPDLSGAGRNYPHP